MTAFRYEQGVLWVENVPVQKIVQAVGTPCYIYSKATLKENWRSFDSALSGQPHKICYAVKANGNLSVLHTLAQCGSGFDIVSGGELARVLAAGGLAKHVVFSGVGKQLAEIEQALRKKIYCFNVESEDELAKIQQVAEYLNVQAPIALRVNPDVDSQSHPYISTGLKESKFGIPIEDALRLYQHAQSLSHLSVQGIACHIGSQLTSIAPFLDAFKRVLALHHELATKGIAITHIDMGGGLGVRYRDETPPTPAEYIKALLTLCPKDIVLHLEPGRAIAAKAGILVMQVLSLKQSGAKNFCIVDAAMNDNLRPALYQAWQDIISVQQINHAPRLYDVVGPVCESGDFLGLDRQLSVVAGDLLAMLDAGAYGFSMSSTYNARPRAAEVMVDGNNYKIVRPRETVEQLFAQEIPW
jgi:diaminopimelate decarboxylase